MLRILNITLPDLLFYSSSSVILGKNYYSNSTLIILCCGFKRISPSALNISFCVPQMKDKSFPRTWWQNVHFGEHCSLKAEGWDLQSSVFYMMKVSSVRFRKCAQHVTGRITVLWLRGNLEKKPWSKAVISLRQREIYAWKLTVTNAAVQRVSLFSHTLSFCPSVL